MILSRIGLSIEPEVRLDLLSETGIFAEEILDELVKTAFEDLVNRRSANSTRQCIGEVVKRVEFSTPMVSEPSINLAVCALDSSQAQNLRYRLACRDVSSKGFLLVFKTWSDTRIASASVTWIAIANGQSG